MSAQIPKSYCLKCKGETGNSHPEVLTNKSGQPYLSTKCTTCGKKKSRMMPRDAIRSGQGFWRDAGKWLTRATGSALGGVLGAVVPGGSILGSAAGGYGGSKIADAIFGKGIPGRRRVVTFRR